jgi:aminoglycoside 2'-N-acetyltransferase I
MPEPFLQGHDLNIRIVPAVNLAATSTDEILALCERAYGEDYRSMFHTFASPVHVIGTIGDAIVAHALWVTRWLASGPIGPLRTAYVEAVATEPQFQRRGYASLLMQRLIDAVADFDLAALSASDQGQSIYARLGWQTWSGPLFIRTDTGAIATPDDAVMIHTLPGTPRLDTASPLSAEWREGELW